MWFDVLLERHPRTANRADRIAQRASVVLGVERWFNRKYLALFAEQRPAAKQAIARLFQ